nr:condensation domain-containing protein [Micromonospora sp. NBC_00855]
MSGPDTWPASLWQRFALTLDRARPGAILGPGFTMNTVLRIRGPLRLTVLAAAVDELVRRHDVLRTRLALDGAEPLQVVTPQVTGLLEVLEGPDVPEPDGWTHAPVASDRSTPMRVRVAQVDVDEHILALHLHHLMADPVTLWTVVDELAALYGSALGGAPPPAPGASYGQYASAEADQARTGWQAAHDWWSGTVGAARFAAVRDGERGAPFAYRAACLGPAETAAVESLSRRTRGTPFVTLLAATACAMAPHLGAGDTLLINTLFTKRDRPQWQRSLGPCIVPAYLPLPRPPARLDGTYVRRVRDVVLGCQRHVRFPIGSVDVMHPYLTDSASVIPFFEYLPRAWPAPVAFGPATGVVVAAAGPVDSGLAGALGIRVRTTDDDSLAGHFSGDGVGWTRDRTAEVVRNLAVQIRRAADEGTAVPRPPRARRGGRGTVGHTP